MSNKEIKQNPIHENVSAEYLKKLDRLRELTGLKL